PRGDPPTRSQSQEVARPEFSSRSQPHRSHRARGGSARGRGRRRDRSRAGRPPPCASRRRRAPGGRSRTRPPRDPRPPPARVAALDEIAARYPGRLRVVAGDALNFDPRPLLGSAPARVVANLPYNIATALLVCWLTLEPWPPWYDRLVLMFQREVAERVVAAP